MAGIGSPYLSAGFEPLRIETEVSQLRVDGDWPSDLAGTLYRIGPNPQFDPIEPYNPLLGDGMVHAFRVRGGAVAYRNRWVRTQQWQLEHAAGRALFATADPRRHDPAVAGLQTDGVANTHLIRHAGRLLALEEGHAPIELDPGTLETHGVWNLGGRLPDNMTAHPKIDPGSGEMVFFANHPGGRYDGRIDWYVADAAGVLTRHGSLASPFPAIVHDFAVTADFLVFVIGPVTLSLRRARAGGPPLAWEPALGTRVAVLRRDGCGEPRWLTVDPCFVWHVLNAWNEGDTITVDLCSQGAPAFPHPDGSMTAESDWRQRLERWRLTLAAGDVQVTRLSEAVCEYPRIDDRFAMQSARHGYFACHGGPGTGDPFHRGIGHFDQVAGRMVSWRFGSGSAVSEPVFVPRADGVEEGDGFLLCVVYEEATDRSLVALLDARRVESGPVARAFLDHRVPMGFHGCWLAAPSDE